MLESRVSQRKAYPGHPAIADLVVRVADRAVLGGGVGDGLRREAVDVVVAVADVASAVLGNSKAVA